ncbi:MAG: hypothetical protein WD271_04700 [Acidimicrobiia bacterium]
MLTEPAHGAALVAEGTDRSGATWLVRRAALAYVAIAIALTAVGALATSLPDTKGTLEFGGSDVLAGWCHYDCGWYVDIADRGYFYIPGTQSSVAFFPGYPLVARPLARLIDNTPLALIMVTWVAGLATVMLFAFWCATRLERRTALTTVACFALYPYGWFLYGAGYADALFLALAIGAFVLLERDHALLAGLAGAAAGATRPVGVAVAVGLLLRAIERRGGLPARTDSTRLGAFGIPARLDLRALQRRDLWVLLAPAGLVAWSVWLWARFDDPFAYSTVQKAWQQAEGPHTWFKLTFGYQVLHDSDFGYRAGLVVQALLTLVVLVAVPLVARRFGASYGAYTLAAVALPAVATSNFQGMGRYLLGAFPVFALAGTLLAERPRVRTPVLVGAGTLLVIGAFGFARHWYLT